VDSKTRQQCDDENMYDERKKEENIS